LPAVSVDSVGQRQAHRPSHWTDWFAVAPEAAAVEPTAAVARELAVFVPVELGIGESERSELVIAAVDSVVGDHSEGRNCNETRGTCTNENLHEECLRAVLVHAINFAASLPPGVSGLTGYHGSPVGLCQLSYAPTPEALMQEVCYIECAFREPQLVSFDLLQNIEQG
jgi:hypothetical protein